jgi:2-polyprenyl-6-methoxyphenol hydroxylase-like FAD-dependent oxidoreductase
VDWIADLAWYTPAGWSPRFASGLIARTCSRALLEFTLRQRVTAIPAVTVLAHTQVAGLETSEDRGRVAGVRLRSRMGEARAQEAGSLVEADLVVDASGRSSRAEEWLSALGYPSGEETVVNSHYGYATRHYRRPARAGTDRKILLVRNRPPFGTRTGMILPVEGDQWIVNLGGAGAENPPTDEPGFLEFARSLIHPAIYYAIKDAEPLSKIHGYQNTANRFRQFHRLERWPEGYLVMGDAAVILNPMYGQGMTVAGLEAMALKRWLGAGKGELAFQKDLAEAARLPWLMATNEDRRIPGAQAPGAGRFDALIQWYLDEVQWLAGSDPAVLREHARVTHLVSSPAALFAPRIALKVLGRSWRKGRRF